MTVNERRKYLKLVAPRYAKGGRAERSRLLTEMEAVSGLHRKSLLRLLHAPSLERAPQRRRVGRRTYGPAVADVVGGVGEQMEDGFRRVQARLPFPITHLHPDNGSEFFNHHLVRYFGETITGLTLSRSRPYQKNDTGLWSRRTARWCGPYVGYGRLETPRQYEALNALYEQLWVYYNLFQPVLHQVSKEVVNGKLTRRWDTAQTPISGC